MVVMILGSGFEPVEAIAPCDILRRGGVEVQLAGIGTDFLEMARAEAQKALDEATKRASEIGVEAESVIVESTDPAHTIVATAQEAGCDLIAMASRGRSGLKALVLGSVTTRVLTESKIPVIVYR